MYSPRSTSGATHANFLAAGSAAGHFLTCISRGESWLGFEQAITRTEDERATIVPVTQLLTLICTYFTAGLWIYPYMILYFKQLGLTTTECSIILGIVQLFNGFFKFFIGAVADKVQRHREITLIFTLGSTVLINCLQVVPPVETIQVPGPADWNGTLYYMCRSNENGMEPITCTVKNESKEHLFPMVVKGGSEMTQDKRYQVELEEEFMSLSDCSDQFSNASFHIQDGCWNRPDVGEAAVASLNNSDKIFQTSGNKKLFCQVDCRKYPDEFFNPGKSQKPVFGRTFWMTFWLYLSGLCMHSSDWILLYGMMYAMLGEKRHQFGKQYLWTTLGTLTTAIISAFAMNKYGSATPEITFTPCFIGFGVLSVITGIVTMFFKLPHMGSNPTMARDLCQLFKQGHVAVLFTVLFFMGFLFSVTDTFVYMFLTSLGASSWTLGVCLFVRYFGEIPLMYYSGKLIQRIGHVGCVYIVLVAYVVRYLGTSLIPNPWWEIPFSLLSSVMISIGFNSVSVYSSLITPPAMHATLQATVNTIHFGIGEYFATFFYC